MTNKITQRFVFTVIGCLFLIGGIVQSQAQPVFRIGILDDEQGDVSRGTRLAIAEINATGGVQGADGTVFQLEAVIQPTTDLNQAVTNINQASVIAVMGPATSEVALGGIQSLQSLNVPVFTTATDDTLIANDGSGRIFRTRAQEVLQGRALANYIANDLAAQSVVTVQLDLASTASVIGFANAITGQGIQQHNTLLLDGNTTLEQLAGTINQSNPQVVVAYGPTAAAAELYTNLINLPWAGRFAYNQAASPDFRQSFTEAQLNGVLSATSWSHAATDNSSTLFMTNYVRAFGAVPGANAAASYDAVNLLALAIGQPGDLLTNLAQIDNFAGVQGALTPAQLTRGEISTNVIVTQLGEFGAPQVAARYVNSTRIQDDLEPVLAVPTTTPMPSATPSGPVVIIESQVQNVRSGPSVNYQVLGQVAEGEVIPIIGATVDFSWVVISYRGQQGWLATYLLEVAGDRSQIPVIAPPATPTPGPTNTPPPVPDIVILSADPDDLVAGDDFTINVTVRNNGNGNAGPFAIAASFQPGDVFAGVTLDAGLQAQQQTVVQLTGELGDDDTGPENVVIVADLNQQVDEGPAGEDNNDDFIFSYFVDRDVQNTGTISIAPAGTLTLEGSGTIDLLWDGNDLQTQNGAVFEKQDGINYSSVHYELIDAGISDTTLNVGTLPDAVVTMITAEGNRAVFQVRSVTAGGNIEIRFRVYD